jgi:RimJ/RimL family protein N-acetyltransferase
MTVLHTARLRFEPMADAHLGGLHAMNADPEVMRYIGGQPETRDETRAMIARVQARWDRFGFGWWTLLDSTSGAVVGAAGVHYLGHDPVRPHEIGWRLARAYWGRGLATEAGDAVLRHVFETLDAPLACAIRHPANRASQRVMARLGMRHAGFYGPDALHELTRADWRARIG